MSFYFVIHNLSEIYLISIAPRHVDKSCTISENTFHYLIIREIPEFIYLRREVNSKLEKVFTCGF